MREQPVIDVDWGVVVNFTGSEAASSWGATTALVVAEASCSSVCAPACGSPPTSDRVGSDEDQQMGDTLGL